MKSAHVLRRLEALSSEEAKRGMARYGITPRQTYGVSIPHLRAMAREAGKDHRLAQQLWAVDTRETRILASMVEEPARVSDEQLETWVGEFDYWEICDQCCMNLFEKLPAAYRKAREWSQRRPEFVRRAGFVLMARLAVSDRETEDERFQQFFPFIVQGACDQRIYVKKGVSWALRQIGKRNRELNQRAVALAGEIGAQKSAAARWVARDVLRELTSEGVRRRWEKKRA
ncbi:MAG TPA: DNA alkylation repair protein [Thermoplasmatales archaeon]|nr:DNA alkylation repair protein [Thermoplasmatales archaeon]